MPRIYLPPAASGKRAMLWTAIFFLCSQLALSAYLLLQRPEIRDPVYGNRLKSLQQRLAENQDAPLALILGSSRAMNGLSPAAFGFPANGSKPTPLIYNFALSGSGSVRELMTFRRLLAAGVRPEWLLIETWPPMWPESGRFDEKDILVQDDPHWIDAPLLWRYLPGKRELLSRTVKGSLVPLLAYRTRLLHASARTLLPRKQAWQVANEMSNWHSDDGTGWIPVLSAPETPEGVKNEVERGRLTTAPLLNPLRVHASSDESLRAILDECRARQIKTALLLMPEHSECRRWYSTQAQELVRRYLGDLSREYHVPVIDVRDWVSDDGFTDFCHMAKEAAAPFSRRFGRKVLQPWLAGEPLSRDVLLKTENP
jgi:hypothetical protein